MVQINIAYQGELRCEAEHAPSGTKIYTDAPVDNNGKGESFSPTDLVATGLGACMLTVMGIAAERLKLDLSGAKVTVVKEMATSPVRRIGKLTVVITIPNRFDASTKEKLEKFAHTCPVHKSLHPDVVTPIKFIWG